MAMPVAMLVIVPTSRGVSSGVNASRARAISANIPSNIVCKLAGSRLMCASFHFVFRLIFRFQQLAHTFFQRCQVIRDTPSHLVPIRREFNPRDQIGRCFEPDTN